MTDQEFQTLEMLLRKFRDDESVDREEWDKRESLRFDVEFECETRCIPVRPNAPADRPAVAGKVRRDVGLVMGCQATLDDCPPGLFVFDGGYGFKTEYNDANGPEAYCLESGEYFWGGVNGDVHARRMLLVTPFHLEPNAALTGGVLAVPSNGVVGQGYRVNSDEWWMFDTEKYDFFHEQCCDCGLNHKTHVRLKGTKIHFRHERRDRPPTPDEIDNTDLPNSLLDRNDPPNTGAKQ